MKSCKDAIDVISLRKGSDTTHYAGWMGRILPTLVTNQIAGFVEYCLLTN